MTSTPDDTTPTKDPIGIALVAILGAFLANLDGTAMNVALPVLRTHFGGGGSVAYSTIAWIVLGYTLAQAAIVPLTDWIRRWLGARRAFAILTALFTVTSLACGVAPSLGMLIFFRVLQGLGGGCLMPLGVSVLAAASPPGRLGRMMSIMGVPMLLAPVLGPIIGGWLVQYATWRWIFFINIPFGLIAVVLALKLLPDNGTRAEKGVDFLGVGLMSPGLALLLWAITGIGSNLPATQIIPLFIVGAALVVAFVRHALKAANPLLDLRVFADRSFLGPLVVMMTFQVGIFATLFLVPARMQQIGEVSSFHIGLIMAPSSLASMVTMPIASSRVDRVPVGRIVPWGMAGIAVGVVGMALMGDLPWWVMCFLLIIMGLGMGATMMPTSTASIQGLPPHAMGNATTVYTIVGQVMSASGVAMTSTVLARGLANAGGDHDGVLAAYGWSFAAAAVVLVIGFGLSFLLPRDRVPRPTEQVGR
ncbi:DHA2 family efflux MFS transporter permease subunit [Nanchangia anserum]|uniref:DHA2 family efflux MFS transporter permease subunit n=1 Tax=Nanchangia anserum TaxID=2692125 RepID=A0A8I0GBI5_9ACTO|nr:DHA2 family efflux MFS transporter permease subunit [Nanchangia anserum]MBD3689743.1 DHA2 family efflux MFS transporter permease subunit [Nanchangia anserum]QOX81914.1 DHA2 family efflux MFS transporter permease subunit [Nanchangia anserum]